MGRTFEVLGSRLRKAVAVEPAAAIPFPTANLTPDDVEPPELVPVGNDDLPGDDNEIPHIEVGGPRAKLAATPKTAEPKIQVEAASPAPGVAFHLFTPHREIETAPAADLIAYHKPEHPTARQFRLLSDGIAAQHTGSRPPVLLFTCASTQTTGTSTVANLAATRAADGTGRILIIELERISKSAAEQLGVASAPGLKELLARTVPLTLALHRTAVDGVYLIPPGKTRVGEADAARLPALLDQLRNRFDWLLVEAPIWGTQPLDDWAKASDGVYLVLRPDEWDSPAGDVAAESIAKSGGRLRGCVTITELGTSPASTNGDGRGHKMVDHVSPPIGVPSRGLRSPQIVRRPGDE